MKNLKNKNSSKKEAIQQIKRADSFICVTNECISVCANPVELMAMLAAMFESFEKDFGEENFKIMFKVVNEIRGKNEKTIN